MAIKSSIPTKKEIKKTTRLVVKHDAGFPNNLFIRGNGPELNWDRGLPLKNISRDEWVWETNESFTTCEFKVLINDRVYESGDNQLLKCGEIFQHNPRFN